MNMNRLFCTDNDLHDRFVVTYKATVSDLLTRDGVVIENLAEKSTPSLHDDSDKVKTYRCSHCDAKAEWRKR